ncbi:NAD-dependent epimerase/dehydratase family protein [Aurantiacibacter sp. D1-12]|uniref:NAD-dependent epimerase/dehydratase family protein n=1 Tax=Aurantiacibacter sp. D1-12 TaxID=2993658 RepID=UPI00237C6948|nr:NAD-dependent epimerase/dehydratase family protein [Aurantiacibacter sp. D1-12]MDE1468473.1 NAD-dependent epimerase/dehydratase family protein [Aurantiacibacter sp. D1-12]
MEVFVLGGTGSIGTAIARELHLRGHQATGLSRSLAADKKLLSCGVKPVRGRLENPKQWLHHAAVSDAVIQVAATFGDDMSNVDWVAMSALIEAARTRSKKLRMIYTGGCWLYGQTGNLIATENRPFKPLKPFAWMVAHSRELLRAPSMSTAVVHPAMVYHSDGGGVFERFSTAARAGHEIEVWGSINTRWPLIERSDLARAYCDLVERPELIGHFNAAAETGIPVGKIVSAIAQAHGCSANLTVRNVEEVVAEHGAWAEGPTLDQQMSNQKLRCTTGWKPLITDFEQSGFLD